MSSIEIQLSPDQALVLFEFLAREEEQLAYGCDAERSVVWQIQAQLEKSLVAPLEADYAERAPRSGTEANRKCRRRRIGVRNAHAL